MSCKKNFLTLNDLYSVLSDRKRSYYFDASKSGTPLLVHSLGSLNYEESDDDDGLTKVEFIAANTGSNLNRSYIDYDVMKDKLVPTFKNRPILGYIHEVDGEPCFYTHNMHIDPDTDEIVYDEIAVGVIPETNNATLEYNEEDDNYNLKITGYLFNEYTKAVEILNREKECAASVEIAVSKMSYDAKNKLLNIEDGYFAGITILGKTPDGDAVQPGMKNANVKIKDFEATSVDFFANIPAQDELKKVLAELCNKIDNLNLNGKEVEQPMHEDNFEKENIDTNVEEFEDSNTDTNNETEVIDNVEESLNEASDNVDSSNDESADESGAESETETFDVRVINNGHSTYELSHDDIRYALYRLLDSVSDNDNEWYYIEAVYDDHFVYANWNGDKLFGQNYVKDGDNVAFEGDRFELFKELLTKEEKDNLDSMRSNYSTIEAELNDYREKDLNAQRNQIISDESYANFATEPEFVEISEKLSEYTPEELRTACDLAFAKCVKRVGSFERHNRDDEDTSKTSKIFAFGAFDHESDFLKNLLNNKH